MEEIIEKVNAFHTKLRFDEFKSLLSQFVENGGDINFRYKNGDTLLHYLCDNNVKQLYIKLVLDLGGDPNIKNNRGQTPLFMAINYENHYYHDIKNIDLLIKYGADVNSSYGNGNILIIKAAQDFSDSFDSKIIVKLLQNGADLYHQNDDYVSAFSIILDTYSGTGRDFEQFVYDYFDENEIMEIADDQLLESACNIQSELALEIIVICLENDCILTQKALTNAILNRSVNLNFCKYLLSYNPDVNYEELLINLLYSGDESKAIFLMETIDMNLNYTNSVGLTPLMAACRILSYKCIEFLLNRNVDVNIGDSTQSALWYLIFYHKDQISNPRFRALLTDIINRADVDFLNIEYNNISTIFNYLVTKDKYYDFV